MYKGVKKKVDLVYTLRESGCSDDSIATRANQRLVQALISKDMSRNLGKASDDEDSEDERSNDEGEGDNEESADEGEGDNEEAADDEGDNEEAADYTTALGFMKLLEVDIPPTTNSAPVTQPAAAP